MRVTAIRNKDRSHEWHRMTSTSHAIPWIYRETGPLRSWMWLLIVLLTTIGMIALFRFS